MNTLWCDLETFSPINLKNCGAHKYAENVGVLLFGYAVDDEPAKVWDLTVSGKMPADLRDALADPDVNTVWHNGANFDATVLRNASNLRVDLPYERVDDCMVKAFSHGLPGKLADLCEIYGLPVDKAKDKDGNRLVQKFCKPDARGRIRNRFTDPEDWKRFVNYCRLDVEAMRTVYKKLPSWNWKQKDREQFNIDQRINNRGILIDTELVDAALVLAEKVRKENSKKTQELTDGAVGSATQRDAMLRFILAEFGVDLPDLTRATIEKRLEDENLPEPVKELLRVRLSSTKTSTAKYKKLVDCVNSDGRLRGCLQFRGASRTGRYCLTGDHEVLTETGWVRLDQWGGGKIAVWNKDSEAFSFQQSEALSFDYEGPMYRYNSARCMQISTPDHRMPYLTKHGRWAVDTVENLTRWKRVVLPFTGVRQQPATLEHEKLRVLLMVQADGYYTSDGQLKFNFKKLRKIERCKTLLRREGIPFTVSTSVGDVVCITIPSRHIPLWLRIFKDKQYGYWLLNESADVIFDEIPHWDGNRSGPNSIQYTTCNKHNADLIQALACLSGRTATILEKKRDNPNWAVAYIVNIWLNPGRGFETRDRPEKIEGFKGKVYCASTPTGFFMVRREGRVWVTGNSGRGPQFQNLPRPSLSQWIVDLGYNAIKEGWAESLADPSELMASCLRGCIIAPEGKHLVVADLSNIEGRMLAWLAGEDWKLAAFRKFDAGKGPDLYKATYGRTFGIRPEDVTKKQRQIGKVMELALGYQGGVGAFRTFALAYGIDLDELAKHVRESIDPDYWDQADDSYDWAKEKKRTHGLKREAFTACDAVKRAWRDAHPAIQKFWKDIDEAAVSALNGVPAKAGRLWFSRNGSWLRMRLPSGRFVCYPGAQLEGGGFGEGTFSYMGVNQYNRKWERLRTFGGKCCENSCQATAADILIEAMKPIEEAGFNIVLSIHDEFITEAPLNKTHEELERLMSTPPKWADGLPLAAAGYTALRYRKE